MKHSILISFVLTTFCISISAQCLVPANGKEDSNVNLTGFIGYEGYPCFSEEACPDCITMVLNVNRKIYYLTGETIDLPEDLRYSNVVKVDVRGTIGSNEHYDWLRVDEWKLSEEPITTNIITMGYVVDEDNVPLSDIQVIVHSEDGVTRDTVYSQTDGEYVSCIKKIPYPVSVMYVTAIDTTGHYLSHTGMVEGYTYDCGVGFNPEADTASNMEPLMLIMKKITDALEQTATYQDGIKKMSPDGIITMPDGRRFSILGVELK